MKNLRFLTAGLLLAWALTTQAGQVRGQTYVVGADVDANGRITATQVDADVPANVADVLADAVKQWEFEPATDNGRPVPAHTFLRVKLQAVADTGGRDTLRLDFIGNGPRLDKTNPTPRYPVDAARAHEAAFLFLEATVQPDGSLTDLSVRSQFASGPTHPSFEQAVLAAARHWHATPEQVDGQPVATKMRIPVNFTLSAQRLTREQVRALHDAAAMEKMLATISANPPPNPGSVEPVALDSPLHARVVAAIQIVD